MKPPPPMLPACGCVTASAKPTATAASTALPPRFRISTPTRVARFSWLATMPFFASTGWKREGCVMIGAGGCEVWARAALETSKSGKEGSKSQPGILQSATLAERSSFGILWRCVNLGRHTGDKWVRHSGPRRTFQRPNFARLFGAGRFALLAVVLGVTLSGCGINTIPTLEEQAKAKWAEVQNQYQRRADLIPNLVETVKGYAKQEAAGAGSRDQRARARDLGSRSTPDIVTDPEAFKKFQEAQSQLSGALGRLIAISENYPDLKSNQNFLALQSQLEGTENRIAVARRDYIEAVRAYNTELRTFPGVLWASTLYSGQQADGDVHHRGRDQAPAAGQVLSAIPRLTSCAHCWRPLRLSSRRSRQLAQSTFRCSTAA